MRAALRFITIALVLAASLPAAQSAAQDRAGQSDSSRAEARVGEGKDGPGTDDSRTDGDLADSDIALVCSVAAMPDLTVEVTVSTLAEVTVLVLRDNTVFVDMIRHAGIAVDDHPSAGPHSYTAMVQETGTTHNCGTVDVAPYGCVASNHPGLTDHVLIWPNHNYVANPGWKFGPAVLVTLIGAGGTDVPAATISRIDPRDNTAEVIATTDDGTTHYLDDEPDLWFWVPFPSKVLERIEYSAMVDGTLLDCGEIAQQAHGCWPQFSDDFTTAVIHMHPDLAYANPPTVFRIMRASSPWLGPSRPTELVSDFVPGQLEYIDDSVWIDDDDDADAPYFYYSLRTQPDDTRGAHVCKWSTYFKDPEN